MKFLLFTILIAALTVLNIGKSLQFSLAGDDWAALYYYHKLFDGFWSYFQLERYLGMYDFSFILMGTIENIFGFNPFPYYFFSMFIRIATSLSFYPMVLNLTKDKKAAYLSCILFAFAYGGIESTNWVFNMATYIALGFFNLFLWQYFKNIDKQNLKILLLEAFFLFFSFYAAPNRMAPLLIAVPLIEVARVFIPNHTKQSFLRLITKVPLKLAVLLAPVIAFNLATASKWDKGYATMIPRLSPDNFNPIFYFFSNIGSALIPDKIFQMLFGNLSLPDINNLDVFLSKGFLVIVFFLILVYLLSFSLIKKSFFLVTSYCLIPVYTLIFFLSLQGNNINQFGNIVTFLDTLIGGYILIIFPLYFFSIKNSYPFLARAGILSLFTSLLFLVAPWLAFAGSYPSDHRYLLIPAAFLMVFISLIISLTSKLKRGILGGFIIIIIMTVNFVSLQSYFEKYLSGGRKAHYVDKLFTQIHSGIKHPLNDKPLVFLFNSNDPFKLYNSITFGFQYHIILTDKRFGLDIQKAPFAVDNFDSLMDVLSSEESSELKRYGYKPAKIPLENIYFFKFENNILTNTTEEGRKLLIEKLPSLD